VRSSHGLSTLTDTWEDAAGCRRPDVDANIFHPVGGRPGARQAALALHICHAHCAVRVECRGRAERIPPRVPQVLGGERWIGKGRGAGRQVDPTPPSAVGCQLCREVS